jgi:hypothetical protein
VPSAGAAVTNSSASISKPPVLAPSALAGGASLQSSASNPLLGQSLTTPAETDAVQTIGGILAEASELQMSVEQFPLGVVKTSKDYRYLEEMLTRLLIRLDNVDAAGSDHVRLARRDAVRVVQSVLDQLELKALAA